MTETQMISLFHQRYDSSSFTNQDLGEDEIRLYLNLEVDRFINSRFTGNNVRKKSFEEDQKRIDDLRTLIKVSSEISSFTSIDEITNSKTFAVPNDYRFYIFSYSKIDKTENGIDYTNSWVDNELIKSENVGQFMNTMFHKPIIDTPKVLLGDSENFTIIYDNDTTLVGVKIKYLRKPETIASGTDCDLPEHTHQEIVEGAVSLALEETESKRFQTENNKLLTSE